MKQKTKASIVVVGSVALDSVKTPYGEVKKALGGSGVYFSCAARNFAEPSMVGVVGGDFPTAHVRLLKKLGINVDSLKVERGKTFHWKGHYTKNLNEAITEKTELNVFADFNPQLNSMQKKAKHLFLANIHPLLQWNVMGQINKPKWIGLDTMNFWIESEKANLTRVIKWVDIVLMNDSEICQYTKEDNLKKAVTKIAKLGPQIIVVKRGEYGAWCFTPNGHFALPAFLLSDAKDPTGAGDSFAGGFLGYLTQFSKPRLADIKEAALRGALVASFNVQGFSVESLQKLKVGDLNKRLKEYRSMLV